MHRPAHNKQGANGGAANRLSQRCPTKSLPLLPPRCGRSSFFISLVIKARSNWQSPTPTVLDAFFLPLHQPSLVLFAIGLGLIADPLEQDCGIPVRFSGSPNSGYHYLFFPGEEKKSLLCEILHLCNPQQQTHFSRYPSIPPRWSSKFHILDFIPALHLLFRLGLKCPLPSCSRNARLWGSLPRPGVKDMGIR